MRAETGYAAMLIAASAALGGTIGMALIPPSGSARTSRALDDANGVGCGIVVDTACCTPSAPPDSACACYGQGIGQSPSRLSGRGDCACRNAAGAPQTGHIVTCDTGPYGWIEQHPGHLIVREGLDICSTYKSCVSGPVTCSGAPPCAGKCSWQETQWGGMFRFRQGEACE
jgi:hypothetical protein